MNEFYWVRLTNVCSCEWCTKNHPPPLVTIAEKQGGEWLLIGTDEGPPTTTHPIEVEVLERIENKWEIKKI